MNTQKNFERNSDDQAVALNALVRQLREKPRFDADGYKAAQLMDKAAEAIEELLRDKERLDVIKELKQIQTYSDTEIAHMHADDVLCQLLRELGYADVVEEYEKVNKWYA